MSDFILPAYLSSTNQMGAVLNAPEVKVPSSDTPEEGDVDTRAVSASQLPKPSGWKVLCAVPEIEDTFDKSVIVKATQFMRSEEHATTVLFVLRCGPEAYADKDKYPSGAWCKEGDFVLVRAYSGTRFKIHGREFRMINDDQVEGVVEDPRGYSRAA
jgi:co-chaperonin GroES (HSP10)